MNTPLPNPLEKPSIISQVSDDDMAMFVGKDWEKFEPTWRAMKYNENGRGAYHFKNINWLGLLASPVWFAYRKMYLTMFLYMVAAYVIEVALGHFFQTSLRGAYGVVVLVAGRLIYLTVSAQRIFSIRQKGGAEETIKAAIVKAGGVSNTALVIGWAIIAFLIASLFLTQDPDLSKQLEEQLSTTPFSDKGAVSKPPLDQPHELGQPVDGSITSMPNVEKK